MTDQTRKVVEVNNEQQKINDFIKEYKFLCENYELKIVVNPAFKSRDDGTFSLVLQTSIGKISKK